MGSDEKTCLTCEYEPTWKHFYRAVNEPRTFKGPCKYTLPLFVGRYEIAKINLSVDDRGVISVYVPGSQGGGVYGLKACGAWKHKAKVVS